MFRGVCVCITITTKKWGGTSHNFEMGNTQGVGGRKGKEMI